ncbi:transposase [Pseudarthrobacter sp. NPDC058196]|uniref:transposase n=1 Tax=Pseudarthrobacter sp. NPDC058196 TaxID=3346376 RepID=UPI0036DD676F
MGDEEQRRKAVSAVLDNGMTQVSVCKQHGITAHRLRVWLAEERVLRAQPPNSNPQGASESTEMRLQRLVAEWEQHEVQASQIVEGLQRARRAQIFFDYVIGGPLSIVAGILGFLLSFMTVLIIFGFFEMTSNGWYAAIMSLLAAAADALLVACIWSLAQYFTGLIFRSFAPFSYAVSNLQQAWLLLEQDHEAIFAAPRTDQDKSDRHKITKRIGRAAHILDATRRPGRDHGSRISRRNERNARRKVAAYVAKAEELLWDKGRPGRLRAIEILQIAAYETVLRKWTLHEFRDVADPEPITLWRRRISPFLKGVLAFGGTFGPIAWQVFGAEDQSPGHFIRAYLHSRGLL